MLVDTFLRYTNARLKNNAAFKHPNRKAKVRLRLMKKQMDLAFKRLTKSDIDKYFKTDNYEQNE